MSAHNTYPHGYIAECVTNAIRYGADNVGGIIVTEARDPGPLAPFVVAALTHRFGVGNSLFRIGGNQAQWVDTVFGGCYRRDVFERVGLFNEALVRGQDIEFNLRLKRAGLRTLLVPSIRSVYHARSRFGDFLRHNWINGMWAVLPFLYVRHAPVRLRHLVPLAFVAAIMGAIVVGLRVPDGWWLLGVIVVSYALIATVAALDIAKKRREWRFVVAMPFVFLALHLSYGSGSLFGVLRLTAALLPRPRGRGSREE
jgi:GT2 family glycosyltransferase